jgi:pyrimidine operon attenuation protein / uracil phosphoribosyltransferase
MQKLQPSSCNNISMKTINSELDAEALYSVLVAHIKAGLAHIDHLAIVGIYSGGAWLAERLANEMGLKERLGFIDVSFYRDDYAKKGLHSDVKPSQIPFEIKGATIILVDDVLYTGRTTRAAMNELFDYGRPARIMLAALVDRGGRELPIAPDFVADTITLPENQSLILQRTHETDKGRFSLAIHHA